VNISIDLINKGFRANGAIISIGHIFVKNLVIGLVSFGREENFRPNTAIVNHLYNFRIQNFNLDWATNFTHKSAGCFKSNDPDPVCSG
jgi:hypothetical protein